MSHTAISTSLEDLNGDPLHVVASKCSSAKDIAYLLQIKRSFLDLDQEPFYKSFMESKFSDKNKYQEDDNYFPRQDNDYFSWKNIAIVDFSIETSPVARHSLVFFKRPKIGRGFEVNISNNGFRNYVGFMFQHTANIHHDIDQCINLMTLHTQPNKRMGENINSLANNLINNRSIIGISLKFQNMESVMEDFCEILENDNKIPNIKILNLLNNYLTNISACRLATVLAGHKLEALNLRENLVTDIGAGALAMMLGINTSIVELDLNYNYLEENGKNLIKKVWTMTGNIPECKRNNNNLHLEKMSDLPSLKSHYSMEDLT